MTLMRPGCATKFEEIDLDGKILDQSKLVDHTIVQGQAQSTNFSREVRIENRLTMKILGVIDQYFPFLAEHEES